MTHSFDVIVPTYNRPDLLARTLKSLDQATVPHGVDVNIIVVDNNSDASEAFKNASLVASLDPHRFRLVVEKSQGSSYARNAGIIASSAEWIGFVDDDEQVDASWLVAASRQLALEHVDFISGPCLPDWESDPPAWLPASIGKYISVVGWIELTDAIKEFNRELNAMAMGGNFAIKRKWFDALGFYNTGLGRVRGRLLSSEDHDMHERLIAAGARGYYIPDLIIHHFIPTTRLTKKYHRQWAFWHGYSMQHLERVHPPTVPPLGGIPRYLIGNVVRNLPSLMGGLLAGSSRSPQRFASELDLIEVLGRLYAQASPSPIQANSASPPLLTAGGQISSGLDRP